MAELDEASFKNYLKALKQDENEHSNRTPLENLLATYVSKVSATLTQEAKNQPSLDSNKTPDFTVKYNSVIVGLIETKKIGEDLDNVITSQQITDYNAQISQNIILSDYKRFIHLQDKEIFKDVILKDKKSYKELDELFRGFLLYTPCPIVSLTDLAHKLVLPSIGLKIELTNLLNSNNSTLQALKKAFEETLGKTLKNDEFADAVAQTFTYSLFLAKLNLADDKQAITISSLDDCLPKGLKLIKELIEHLRKLRDEEELKYPFDSLLFLINLIDSSAIRDGLSFKKNKDREDKDSYIYFYEDFLSEYDPESRKMFGVYYTPKAVVKAIVNNIDSLLKNEFAIVDGFADENVKTLDFATGTGTFMLEVLDSVLGKIEPNSTDMARYRKNLLANLYGFEIQIAPYVVAHLKLSDYIEQTTKLKVESAMGEALQIYLTNTINDKPPLEMPFMPQLSEHAKNANRVKASEPLMVILGNPPYYAKSENELYKDGQLKQFHDGYKPSGERNPKPINDDYVKFIAFAHQKMAKAERGIFGLVVNSSFLSGITHRKMRGELMKTFSSIYIIDMVEENVFSILQPVCIAIFVKNPTMAQASHGVFYKQLGGRRADKFEALADFEMPKHCQKLEIASFNKMFGSTRWGKSFDVDLSFFYPIASPYIASYGQYWGLDEIFSQCGSGIKTSNDTAYIHYNNDFKATIESYDETKIKVIDYKPFDKRYCYYDDKLLGRARTETMNHMLDRANNIGLVFMRGYFGSDYFNQALVSNTLIDINTYGYQTYIAPLYIYTGEVHAWQPNFSPAFTSFLQQNYPSASAEDILHYIYAILYHPIYRTTYNDLLKIDFPRIPFNLPSSTFTKLASLGEQLINLHLFKLPKVASCSYFTNDLPHNYHVEKLIYNEAEQTLHINSSLYFSTISPAVYNFTIGGFKVLPYYFTGGKSSRAKHNLLLTNDDINHINQMIYVIKETMGIMSELEDVEIGVE